MIGKTISHYRIVEKLGEGGMGVVYKAEDTHLDRTVALKFLAPHLIESQEHKERFLREAKAAASLDHPNICMVHEVGEADGHVFLAMGYVDGPEVRAKIKERPLKLDEALDIAIQAGEGLRAAHQKGIVHRDIKSSNLMLTSSGQVKIMDFGLVLLSGGTRLTKTDTIVGTPAYMAPEQAQRLPADRRTDIWSLGVVLYEMVTGRLPFEGEREQAVIYSIVNEPHEPITALRVGVPTELDHIAGKALAKKPDERYQHIDDLLVDLRALRGHMSARRTPATQSSQPAGTPVRKKVVWAAVGAAGLLAAALLLARTWFDEPSAPARLEYMQLTNFADSAVSPALSPDGRMLSFIRSEQDFWGFGEVYVKLLPDGEPVQLSRDGKRKVGPAVFSRDGSRVAYTVAEGRQWDTWTAPVLGGQPSRMLTNATALTWVETAPGPPRVLFAEWLEQTPRMEVFTSTESRAELRKVYLPEDVAGMVHRAYLSPDGKSVLVVEMDASGWVPCRLIPFDGSSLGTQVGPPEAQCTDAAWTPDGRWMYFSANPGEGFHIWRQRFPDGEPEQVTFGASEEEGVRFAPDGRSFVTSVGTRQSTLWVHDARGERQITAQDYPAMPSFSADGKRLYYLSNRASQFFVSGQGELWVADLETGHRERLLPDFRMAHYNVSRDESRVVFIRREDAGRSSVWLAALDRSSEPRRLTSLDSLTSFFGTDGEVFFQGGEGSVKFLYRIREDGTGLEKVVEEPLTLLYDVSPDGKWLAAWAGRGAVVFPAAGGSPVVICTTCANRPPPDQPHLFTWSANGKFVYFHDTQLRQTFAVALEPGQMLPLLPANGITAPVYAPALAGGAREIPQQRAFGGPNPDVYAFFHVTTHRNIYRISVP